ncbi:MAG TPA: acylphosphatase [Geobacteraceae bacterium]
MVTATRIRAEVTVTGIVQGVSFRKHTLRLAERLGITGWVRNLSTGEVEGCFEGVRGDVETLVAWCGIGPEKAIVEGVDRRDRIYRGDFPDFRILA